MIALVLAALSVGLSNMAGAVAIGVGGVDNRTRRRVGIIFGLFEAGMPVLGLVIGHGLASSVGRVANWVAAGLLIAVGCANIVLAVRARAATVSRPAPSEQHEVLKLLASGFALSLDNLAVGFALGWYHVGVVAGAIVFGLVSAAMSLLGLEVGARIGNRAGQTGQVMGGVVLAGVGLAIGLGAFG